MEDRMILDAFELEFRRLKKLAEGAVDQLEDTEVFAAGPDGANSVAILMKHMSGNMLSRWRDLLTTDGEKPDRDRDSEFVITDDETRESLNERWDRGWACLFGALGELDDSLLSVTVYIRGEEHSVLQAIGRQITHYAYHTGQIVHLARVMAGPRWKTLSVAPGDSRFFNQRTPRYLEGET